MQDNTAGGALQQAVCCSNGFTAILDTTSQLCASGALSRGQGRQQCRADDITHPTPAASNNRHKQSQRDNNQPLSSFLPQPDTPAWPSGLQKRKPNIAAKVPNTLFIHPRMSFYDSQESTATPRSSKETQVELTLERARLPRLLDDRDGNGAPEFETDIFVKQLQHRNQRV